MQTRIREDNEAKIRGVIYQSPRLTHTYKGENFFLLRVAVPRLSGVLDILPVTVPGYLIQGDYLERKGQWVTVEGQLRTYNRQEEDQRRLIITLFARSISPAHPQEGGCNRIRFRGYLCRAPVYRTTPLNREIADLMVAVNRAYHKSDYLPVIAWGAVARLAGQWKVGTCISLEGRLQSREYNKLLPDGTTHVRVAYEVSALSLERVTG